MFDYRFPPYKPTDLKKAIRIVKSMNDIYEEKVLDPAKEAKRQKRKETEAKQWVEQIRQRLLIDTFYKDTEDKKEKTKINF